jgi:hypothetical protein
MSVQFRLDVPQTVQAQSQGGLGGLGGNGTNFFLGSFPSSFVLLPGSYSLVLSLPPSISYSAPPGFCAPSFGYAGFQFREEARVQLQFAPAPGPFIASLSSNANFVAGTSNALSVEASGFAPFQYQWRKSGTNLLGATNSSLVFPAVNSTNAGLYTVVVTNNYKSITSGVVRVTVVNPPSELLGSPFVAVRMRTNGAFTLTAFSDTPFSVVANPDVTEISNQWIYLGPATEIGPGVYEFTDTNLTYNPYRFYRLRWP